MEVPLEAVERGPDPAQIGITGARTGVPAHVFLRHLQQLALAGDVRADAAPSSTGTQHIAARRWRAHDHLLILRSLHSLCTALSTSVETSGPRLGPTWENTGIAAGQRGLCTPLPCVDNPVWKSARPPRHDDLTTTHLNGT